MSAAGKFRAAAAGLAAAGLLLPAAMTGSEEAGSRTIRVTSRISSGPGSIREAIEQANATLLPVDITVELEAGTVVWVFRQLPAITTYGVTLDGGGAVLRGGDCIRDAAHKGCSGLRITGSGIRVRRIKAERFQYDGISIKGPARDVIIEDSQAVDNGDDGIGIAQGAHDVTIKNCLMTGNGFRSKGKGVLVFEGSQATVRDSEIRGNRDGATVSKGSRAVFINNEISDNYDKGLGVWGAHLTGLSNKIARNGKGKFMQTTEPAPNRDGIRIGLDSTVELSDSAVTANGDKGMVVQDGAKVVMRGGRVSDNLGLGVVVRDRARVEMWGTAVAGNIGGDIEAESPARIITR